MSSGSWDILLIELMSVLIAKVLGKQVYPVFIA